MGLFQIFWTLNSQIDKYKIVLPTATVKGKFLKYHHTLNSEDVAGFGLRQFLFFLGFFSNPFENPSARQIDFGRFEDQECFIGI